MKYLLINTLFLLLFSSCSYQNAFSKFNMSKEEELIATNTQSSKIEDKNGVIGIFSAIYINNTDKVYFNKEEHFLISVYMKDPNEKYVFKLNNSPSIQMKELTNIEKYTTYIKNPKDWEKYYIVTFKKATKKLDLTFESTKHDSSVLHFQKY